MGSENRKGDEVQAALRKEETLSLVELEQVFQQHHQRILQAAYRVTGSASDAEDVLQSVFLRLLRMPVLPNTPENLGSYLHRSAVNAAIDHLRAQPMARRVPLEEVKGALRGDEDSSPERQQEIRDLKVWLRERLQELSPQAAEIFALRYLEGYRNQEIADMVGTTAGVVAVVLHRTRNRLKDDILDFLRESHED